MDVKRMFFGILLLLLIILPGMSGCARERPPESFPEAVVTLPPPTPAPMRLPRYTPHVTGAAPTGTHILHPVTPTPVTPEHPPQPQAPTPTPRIHIVQPHETLLDIAVRYQVPLDALARANGITDPTIIKPGDRLVIP